MPILVRAECPVGDLLVRYVGPADRPDAWGLVLLPLAKANEVVAPREWLEAPAITQLPAPWNRTPAWEVDPLVHAHVSGDVLPGGFANGRTLRHSATTASLAVRECIAGRAQAPELALPVYLRDKVALTLAEQGRR